MGNHSQGTGSDETHRGAVLMVIGFSMAALAALAWCCTVVVEPRGSGANIGAVVAQMALVSAGIAGYLGLLARSPETPSIVRSLALGIGSLALVIAGFWLVLVGLGILEELS